MATHMKAIGSKIKERVSALLLKKIMRNISDNGRTIKDTEKESRFGLTETDMTGSGKKTLEKEKDNLFGQMETSLKENGKKTRFKDKEY